MLSLNSISFVPFLLLAYVAYHFVLDRSRSRAWILFVASSLFYLSASPKFFPFLVGLAAIAYWTAKKASEAGSRSSRAAYLAAGVAVPLGTLIFFKANWNLSYGWTMPLGLSYFTFQMIGYISDCAEGSIAPTQLRPLLGSLAFFPTISAGPITSVRTVCPQIESGPTPEWNVLKRGLLLYSNGLFKKMIADILALSTRSRFPAHPLSLVAEWSNILMISASFYADFSGYTDMALGVALLFGIELPENFRLPFLSHSVADHWRRWHITLGAWFRQYVFIPLAAAYGRHPSVSPRLFWLLSQLNIILVMLLIGVWHGFTTNFAIWGLINGILICVSPWFDRVRARGTAGHVLTVMVTFYLTALARVFTYIADPRIPLKIFANAHAWRTAPPADARDAVELMVVLSGLLLPHALDWLILERKRWLDQTSLTWFLILALWVVVLTFGSPVKPFIYMQM